MSSEDHPPCSRLFVSIGPNFTEDEVREAFQRYGDIEYLQIPRDKVKGGNRGYVFVKYKKTSEAAAAVESLNNSQLGAEKNNIHVAVAGARKEDGSSNSDIIPQRIIVKMPEYTEIEDIRSIFSAFGNIVDIIHAKSDNKKAILKFSCFSEAAHCFENCKASYLPHFVLPKKKEKVDGVQGGGNMVSSGFRSGMKSGAMALRPGAQYGQSNLPQYSNQCTKVRVLFHPSLSKDNLSGIFNIIPGFVDIEFLDMTSQGAMGGATYDNPQSAAHAVDRINGLEYPLGSKLEVQFATVANMATGVDSKVSTLLNTIKEATSALKGTGYNISVSGLPDETPGFGSGYGYGNASNYGYGNDKFGGGGMGGGGMGGGGMGGGGMGGGGMGGGGMGGGGMGGGGMGGGGFGGGYGGVGDAGGGNTSAGYPPLTLLSQEVNQRCSVRLPPPQDIVTHDVDVKQRLFFVLRDSYDHPQPEMITDLFCRFGNLVNAHCLSGKKCGYARYSSIESAEKCIKMLNGAGFSGGFLKVEKAEPEKYQKEYKKRKTVDY